MTADRTPLVEAAEFAIRRHRRAGVPNGVYVEAPSPDEMRLAVEAAAPFIEAKALREAARYIGYRPASDLRRGAYLWLRDRADAIEGGDE